MHIDYISDLHINHWIPSTNKKNIWEKNTKDYVKSLLTSTHYDVLVIAGDFSEWNEQTIWILEVASEQYNQVFITLGNHDYYVVNTKQFAMYRSSKGRIDELKKRMQSLGNVTLLDQSVVTYSGITFAGDTLWYKLETFEDKHFFNHRSNDSVFIHGSHVSAEDALAELHLTSMEWYKSIEHTPIDVMVSHIPPFHPPISTYSRNACFDFPAPFLKGKHWICGHQHNQGTFEKLGVTFYMNALGYPQEGKEQTLHSFEVSK